MQPPLTELARVFACLFIFALAGEVFAQTTGTGYPSRIIKMIVPFPPGGPTDVVARIVSQKLSEQWAQPVVIENRAGAAGTIGVAAAAKSPPDGYTIVMAGSSNLALAPNLYAKLPYDPLRDLTPVVNVALVPYVLAIHATVPARSVRELVKLGKANKGMLSYGSAGTGSNSNLAGELLKATTGIDLLQVPYKGAPPLVTAILIGEIDILFAEFAAVASYTRAGKLRMLAAIGSKRLAAAPQLPTMIESGIGGYAIDVWFGIMAPAGTPRDIVGKLNLAIANSLSTPDVRQRFQEYGYEAIGGTAEQFDAMIRADTSKFKRIISATNIRPE